MTSSSGTKRWSPSGDEAREDRRHLDPGEVLLAGVGVADVTARLSDRPEMYGNGCAGSTASGVSTGKIRSVNSSCICFCSSCRARPSAAARCPASTSAGSTSSRNSSPCRCISSRASRQMASSTSRGIRPLAAGTATPAASRRFRPATRTMKNSSRLLAKIARKRVRSSSGEVGSSASSSTRLVEAQPGQLAVEEAVVGQVVVLGLVRRLDVEGVAGGGPAMHVARALVEVAGRAGAERVVGHVRHGATDG